MVPKGLKPGIIITLVLVITTAMLLVDLVMLGTLKQELLKSRRTTGLSLLAVTAPLLAAVSADSTPIHIENTMNAVEATCVLGIDEDLKTIYMAGACESQSELHDEARRTIAAGKPGSSLTGKSWGGGLASR